MSFLYAGSISHGTMRPSDLIPTFVAVLRDLGDTSPLLNEANSLDFNNLDEASDVLDELFDLLDEYAPNGYYFGAHEGDGSDYGFWQIEVE